MRLTPLPFVEGLFSSFISPDAEGPSTHDMRYLPNTMLTVPSTEALRGVIAASISKGVHKALSSHTFGIQVDALVVGYLPNGSM